MWRGILETPLIMEKSGDCNVRIQVVQRTVPRFKLCIPFSYLYIKVDQEAAGISE